MGHKWEKDNSWNWKIWRNSRRPSLKVSLKTSELKKNVPDNDHVRSGMDYNTSTFFTLFPEDLFRSQLPLKSVRSLAFSHLFLTPKMTSTSLLWSYFKMYFINTLILKNPWRINWFKLIVWLDITRMNQYCCQTSVQY